MKDQYKPTRTEQYAIPFEKLTIAFNEHETWLYDAFGPRPIEGCNFVPRGSFKNIDLGAAHEHINEMNEVFHKMQLMACECNEDFYYGYNETAVEVLDYYSACVCAATYEVAA